jgi:hypothetical protein
MRLVREDWGFVVWTGDGYKRHRHSCTMSLPEGKDALDEAWERRRRRFLLDLLNGSFMYLFFSIRELSP